MKKQEFQRWLADFDLRFPDSAAWIAKGDRSDADQIALLEQWADALADVELSDALEVNARIQRGQIMLDDKGQRPGIPAYDRENVPAIIRRNSLNIRVQRMVASPARAETWRDGVKCKDCSDSGFRPVWMNRAIAFYREHGNLDGFGANRHVVVRCQCERGFPRGLEPEEAKPSGQAKPETDRKVENVPRFSESSFCPVFGWDTKSREALANLAAWLEAYEQRRLESAYSGDFADYNRRAGHIA